MEKELLHNAIKVILTEQMDMLKQTLKIGKEVREGVYDRGI